MHNRYLITKYWLMVQFGGKKKWTTFEHNGVLFPEEYKQHGTPIIYKDEKIVLNKNAEEYATLYAKYIETEYFKNKIFNKNFWNDWKKVLDDNRIQSLEDCNFKLIYDHIMIEKEKRKAMTPEEKEKKIKDEEKYKFAIVDGKKQPVGNFRIEPPGIFIGRGCNKKLGKVKTRIYPEDVTINIGKEAKIPDINLPVTPDKPSGYKWGKVIHDRSVEWIASWKDNVGGKTKYVWLAAQSDFKATSDLKKFDLARKLKKNIKKIKEDNMKNLSNPDIQNKQIATALYFIDNLALRVGNEKGKDEADTVGVTSLRVEHIKLLDNNKLTLDFLGKDAVRYLNTITADAQVYKNIQEFMIGKDKKDELFDKINANDINKYLQSFMKGLTAKVFRTFNASNLFQKELMKVNKKYDTYNMDDKKNILLDEFNKANAKVALLCNHQKNISKSFSKQIDKINEMIKTLKSKLKKARNVPKKNMQKINSIKEKINKLKIKKDMRIQMKNISLGTSKINYIDPRITIAFMKKHNLPIDKIFSKTLQDKFKWALDVDPDFKF
ncbi:MAG: dna topoisomerase 1b [Edafosvirus sp.]|uniref:DNA topoisomerase 1 n=1 Tax=Edafosvirus sp. TaxID=2487765 RepID=A0A3G4ZX11_9VIRU|nr:MAG: dna topoisomerase 1b [Edafosvirus sp.]